MRTWNTCSACSIRSCDERRLIFPLGHFMQRLKSRYARGIQRRLALARAVIAWHTTVRGIATLAEISRYLGGCDQDAVY